MALIDGLDNFSSPRARREAQDAVAARVEREFDAKAEKRLKRAESECVGIILALLAESLSKAADGGEGGGWEYSGALSGRGRGASPFDAALSECSDELDSAFAELEGDMLSALVDGAREYWARQEWEWQWDDGHWESVSGLGEAEAAELAKDGWFDGKNYSDRLWADKSSLLAAIRGELGKGISMGLGLSAIAKAIEKRFGAAEYAAKRLMRTEMSRMQNLALLSNYRAHGVRKYEYVAILDERTTDTCRGLDGKRFYVSQAECGVNLPPMHPNCRSTTIPVAPKASAIDADREKLDYQTWLNRFLKD